MNDKHLYIRAASAGSGKTYTLAAHYIALLMRGESYRQILAVTFTNKATAEMKERIIGYLYAIARHTAAEETQGFLGRVREIYKELGYTRPDISSDTYCARRAEEVFTQIMADYDNMRVQTIDAFLQTLLGGMVQMLGGSVGYSVELDVKRVISDAVDRLLTEGARDKQLLHHIVQYMDERMADEKAWDIRRGLREIGEELYREYLQQEEERLVFDAEKLKALAVMKTEWRQQASKELAALQARLMKAQRFVAADFSRGQTSYLNPLAQLGQDVAGADKKREEERSKFMVAFTDTTRRKIQDPELWAKEYKGSESAEAVRQELLAIIEGAEACRKVYLYAQYVTRYLNDMVLMGSLRDEIQRGLDEQNSRLLATTANTLYKALKEGDADFVLEKAGIRYRHVMLDEFQDTSTLQWENFSRLLQELLSTEQGSTLIVGDIKQSIYRWRNGNWKIMSELPQKWSAYWNEKVEPLQRNFRSEKEVVRFNLETFAHLSEWEGDAVAALYNEGYLEPLLNDYYRKGHEGGYVRVAMYPQCNSRQDAEQHQLVRQRIIIDMFDRIEELMAGGARAKQMMILIRRNAEAQEVIEVLEELRKDEAYVHLKDVALISGDCFQLRYSRTVNVLVAAIRYVYSDNGIAREYVRMVCGDTDIEARKAAYRNMALTDMVEAVLQGAGVESGIEDLAYVNAFRDQLRSYVATNGSDGMAFLRYWDESMCTKCIPAVDTDGIRIMTIHASKGLQAENVFIPFADWPMESDHKGSKLWCEVKELQTEKGEAALLPIEQSSTMAETAFAPYYEEEHRLQRVDNLNLLYVALTRAAERLYVYADVESRREGSKPGKPGTIKPREKWDVGQLLAERCGMWEELEEDCPTIREYGEVAIGDRREAKGDRREAKVESGKVTEPFSFAGAEVMVGECHSAATRMEFRQSQDSVNYGWDIAAHIDDAPDMDRRAFGTICHDVLAMIGCYETTDEAREAVCRAVEQTYNQGHIPTEALRDEVLALLTATVTDEQMRAYYTGTWRVQREEAILMADEHGQMEERRMDRVLWDGDRAVVIDYKFGHDNVKYDRQVKHYMQICERLGAKEVEGYLWIASERRLQPLSRR